VSRETEIASLLIRNCANVKLVQARPGHKSATETLGTGLRQGDSKLRVLETP